MVLRCSLGGELQNDSRRNRLRGGNSTHRSNFTLICYLLVMSCYLLHSSQMIPICSRLRLYLSTAGLYGSHLALNECSVEICPLGRFNPGRNLTPTDKLIHFVHYWQSIRLCPDATWLSGTHKCRHTCAPHVIPHRQVYVFNVICDGYPLSPFSPSLSQSSVPSTWRSSGFPPAWRLSRYRVT